MENFPVMTLFATLKMNKKIPKAELEEALNYLEISEESKKIFSVSLKSRNEPLIFGRLSQAIGTLSILGYFMTMFQQYDDFPIRLMMIQLYGGVLFLAYGGSRIRSIKLQRASVELIMKNKNSEPIN
jgi:hypothetical protein